MTVKTAKKTAKKAVKEIKEVKKEVKKVAKKHKLIDHRPSHPSAIDALDNADANLYRDALFAPFAFPQARIPDANGRFATTVTQTGLLPGTVVSDSVDTGVRYWGVQYNANPTGGYRLITSAAAGVLGWGSYTDLPTQGMLSDSNLIRLVSGGLQVVFDASAFSTAIGYVNNDQYGATTSDTVAELGTLSSTRIYTSQQMKAMGGLWGNVIPFALTQGIANSSGNMTPGLAQWRPYTIAMTDTWLTIIIRATVDITNDVQIVPRFVSNLEMVPLPAYAPRYTLSEVPPAEAQFQRSWGAALIKGGGDVLTNLINLTQGLMSKGAIGKGLALGVTMYNMYNKHKGIITSHKDFPNPKFKAISHGGGWGNAAPAALRRHDMACALGAPHLSPFNRKYRVLPDDIIAFQALVMSLLEEENKQRLEEKKRQEEEDEREAKLCDEEAKAIEGLAMNFRDYIARMTQSMAADRDWSVVREPPPSSSRLPQILKK